MQKPSPRYEIFLKDVYKERILRYISEGYLKRRNRKQRQQQSKPRSEKGDQEWPCALVKCNYFLDRKNYLYRNLDLEN